MARAQERTDFDRLVAEGIVQLGKHSYCSQPIDVRVFRDDGGHAIGGRLRVGPYCSIARDVTVFLGGNHRSDWISTYPFRLRWGLAGAYSDGHPTSKGDVNVGADVWIGERATILSGVTIGDGAVIAAMATVASDVRPYAVVAGNPAREVRRRFDDANIEYLLALKWWEWPEERVRECVPILCSTDIPALRATPRP
jgi:acetyltransferase-like isoleucine patch superfamily enzyme